MAEVQHQEETIRLVSPAKEASFHGGVSGSKTAMAFWYEGKDYITTNVTWEQVQNVANELIEKGWTRE